MILKNTSVLSMVSVDNEAPRAIAFEEVHPPQGQRHGINWIARRGVGKIKSVVRRRNGDEWKFRGRFVDSLPSTHRLLLCVATDLTQAPIPKSRNSARLD